MRVFNAGRSALVPRCSLSMRADASMSTQSLFSPTFMSSKPIVKFVDSHTGGEPTRVVVAGGPDLGQVSLAERRQVFARDFDHFRSAVVNEPRGSDVLVGALLTEATRDDCVAGVLFFNNVGMLGMCGHGTIGVVVTLGHLGRITAGTYGLETPVGRIEFTHDGGNRVSLENVPSWRYRKAVSVEVEGHGPVTGDIAWGGNWFFLVSDHGRSLELSNTRELTDFTCRIRRELEKTGITGENGGVIDHVELFGPPHDPKNHSRNFVLCPGLAYDRSPCGTGTSAKLACLYEDGKLRPGEIWRQESILGSVFEGSVRIEGDKIIPRISGDAYITAEGTLMFDPNDPWKGGIRS
jgi:4-hydroxyproline epimerase